MSAVQTTTGLRAYAMGPRGKIIRLCTLLLGASHNLTTYYRERNTQRTLSLDVFNGDCEGIKVTLDTWTSALKESGF